MEEWLKHVGFRGQRISGANACAMRWLVELWRFFRDDVKIVTKMTRSFVARGKSVGHLIEFTQS